MYVFTIMIKDIIYSGDSWKLLTGRVKKIEFESADMVCLFLQLCTNSLRRTCGSSLILLILPIGTLDCNWEKDVSNAIFFENCCIWVQTG